VYVKERSPEEVARDLVEIFKSPYNPIKKEEQDYVKETFAWKNVAKKFWINVKKSLEG
jgi:hypothetical protein